jgi:anti-anti-sigma factor
VSSRPADLSAAPELTTFWLTACPGVDVVSVVGDFDVRYESAVWRLVADPRQVTQPEVVLDLSGVSFLDAGAIGALVRCRRSLARRSATLSIVVPAGHVRRVLELVGLERTVPLYPGREVALRAISTRQAARRAAPPRLTGGRGGGR